MKIDVEFLRGLPVGYNGLLSDVDNVSSVASICYRLNRTQKEVRFKLKTYPLDGRIKIEVLPYDGQGFKDSPSHVEGNQVGTIGT